MRNKKVVRLTESQLHNIITESVKRVLSETKILSKRRINEVRYRNTPHTKYEDGNVYYKGYCFDEDDVWDELWNYYKEVFCRETSEQPSDDGFDAWLGEDTSEKVTYALTCLIDWNDNSRYI